MEERDVEVKMRVIQLHAAGISDRQIARETKVPKSTVWRWIKPFKDLLEEIAERFGKKSFSNRYIKREYASRSPDMAVCWLNKLAETGTVVNGYRVERIYQSSLYGEPYQDFLLIEV